MKLECYHIYKYAIEKCYRKIYEKNIILFIFTSHLEFLSNNPYDFHSLTWFLLSFLHLYLFWLFSATYEYNNVIVL